VTTVRDTGGGLGAAASNSDLVEHALELAAAGRDHAGTSVLVSQESTANLRWACNTLTTNGVGTGRTVAVVTAVRTPRGVSTGTVARRGVTAADLPDLVDAARAVAAAAPPAEDAAELPPGSADADFGDAGVVGGPEVFGSLAAGLGPALREAREQGRELFGYAEHVIRTSWLGTSAGVRRRHVQPSGAVDLTGKSHDRTRSTYVSQATRDFSDVDIRALDDQVRTRLGWQARIVDVGAGRHDTVLPPTAVADLMVYLYWSSDARSAHEGRSVFSRRGGGTRLGDRLTDVRVTMSSDPSRPGLQCPNHVETLASSPYASVFDNGLATPAVTWVDEGRLVALPTTRHTAALTGLPVRPAVDNLVLGSPDASGGLDDLVAGTSEGLLLTSLWYIREVDPVTLLLTGLTRDGVYLVRGGEVAGAVTNFRFNESPVDLLSRIDALGTPQVTMSREWGEWFPRTEMPPMRVRGFNMSSTSQAS